jgi:hypothetical protein
MSNRRELVRQLVALSRRSFFLRSKRCGPTFATATCNKAFIVYRIDADHAEWGTLNMSEVAIQEWSNGKVVREKFVY